jgi:tRNA 2-thiouridine synthesizing protein A
LKNAQSGDLLELLATDPGSRSDVPSWAELSGNELLETSEEPGGVYRYVVRKR